MPDKNFSPAGFGSTAIHGGHRQDPTYAHITPIYASSTYVYDTAEQGMRRFSGQEEGYIYSRWGNPTITEAQEKIAALETWGLHNEQGQPMQAEAILHASGMAAICTMVLSNLKSGQKLLTHYSLYGGSQELFDRILPSFGVECVVADLRDLNKAEDALKKHRNIGFMYLETPANPTLQCVDLEALIALAKRYGVKTGCDNTFATPYLQQPFKYGADFVMHSTTKFLNGHGTAIGGVLVGKDTAFMKSEATKLHRLLGGNSNPFDAFLLVNGMKTLEVRMERHCHNAIEIANFLDAHPAVAKVNYTGLRSHADHAVAMKQMRHPGAMMSFELKGGLQAGIECMNKLQLCLRTVSLGTCETLLCHPASMTHFSVPKEQREQYGITDGLIRMSVGMENVSDIINDLDQSLK
ncbi:MAG TPA: PLP-dependent aspartate aminotransferase family protein [Chitinophagaceae bacterium]|nr:PLP-dependent aspartate aminotransferase family protein [Chitinophagaceae bacterium]